MSVSPPPPPTHGLTVSEQLCYSTVRVECDTGTGTAFYFHFAVDATTYVPLLVTNKHVVEGAKTGRLLLHLSGPDRAPNGKHLGFEIGEFSKAWLPHPDPSVDLCALPMANILNEATKMGHSPFHIAFEVGTTITRDELKELSALEDIVMIGYPNGIWDSVNNMPVIRRGITATHPKLDYEGKPEFMIDAACFPGSSGSPVILYNMGSYVTRQGVQLGSSRVKLLGVLYAGPQHTATGELEVVTVPTQQKVVAFSRIPNNLGMVIKATRLLEFRSLFPGVAAA
jgi:hypothetical protein